MSSYPETIDVFTDLDSADNISSSDPNHAFESVENMQGFLGGMGKPQTWSETLLVLMKNYRRGMHVDYVDGVLYARAGEAVLVSTDDNKTVFRRNPDDVSLSTANIDDGTIAAEYYYVYAKGDALALTAPICFSSDEHAPSGIGTAPYRKIGWFYNRAGGSLAVTFAGSWKDGSADVFNALVASTPSSEKVVVGAYAAFPTVPATINMVTTGRAVELNFNASIYLGSTEYLYLAFFIDGVRKWTQRQYGSTEFRFAHCYWLDANVIAGTHTFEVQAYSTGGDYAMVYGIEGPRVFTAKEL